MIWQKIHISLTALFLCAVMSGQQPERIQVPDTARTSAIPGDSVTVQYNAAAGALQAPADYGATDSIWLDNKTGNWHLIGDAYVNYLTMSIKADYIIFNADSSIATAEGWPDSTGTLAGFPVFTEGDKSFDAKKIRYNFQTEKGIIYDVVTQEGDLYIRGARTKYIGGSTDALAADADDVIYNRSAIITTCDNPEPHYGIRSSKIKTIPGRLAVIGPSNIELNGVPTPLWLPFGFFPITSSKRAGLIFPNDYEYSEAWGFGVRGIGYFTPISEYMDLQVLGDIYFNGSWGLSLQSNYVKRYAYRGSINLSYSNRRTERAGEFQPDIQKSFAIRVSHNQDSKAHPYRRLGGSINIQTNDYQSLNQNDANSVLTNTFRSNFSWNRSFPGKPYSVSVSLNHSQNTNSGDVNIEAPNVDFRLNRIYPFKREGGVGKERFYEKISFQYSANSRTKFFAKDTALFTSETWQNAQFGVQHRATADLSFNLASYIYVTPSVNYEEIWFFKTLEQQFMFDPATSIDTNVIIGPDGSVITEIDTTSFGTTEDFTRRGFTPYRRVSTSVSMNTQLFATLQMRKGWLRGFRHVLKPSISFTYTPENASRYIDSVQTNISDPSLMRGYSVFQGGVYSAQIVNETQAAIGYSFNNIFEAKFWSKKDSTAKKVKLFENIVASGNYNIIADSLNFSVLSIRGTTRFFKGATTFTFGAVYDPYVKDPVTNRRIDKFYVNETGKLLRFDNLQLRFNTRLTINKIKEIFSGDKSSSEKETARRETATRDETGSPPGSNTSPRKEPFFDLFENFSLQHNLSMMRIGRPGRDTTLFTTHTVNMRGNMQLTPKWSITIGNIGYDFRRKQLTYPDIGFIRDLHCWNMQFRWQPQRGTYTFHIGVKPGSLDFIKLPQRRNNVDAFGGL